MTDLERVIGAYLDHLTVERGASPNTVAAYRRDLAKYSAFLRDHGVDSIGSVSTALVADFAARLRTGIDEVAPLAPASVARAVVAVRSLHTFALDDGASQQNPAAEVTPMAQGRRLPKALGIAQVQRLLDTPDLSTPSGLRDAVLLELLYGTGARISELTDLDVDDVSPLLSDPSLGLRLFGKGRTERIVPVGSYARRALEAWLVRGRPAMVERAARHTPALLVNSRGDRLSRQSSWAVLRSSARQAGIEVEVSPHTLRHSFATHLLDGGADVRVVQELLGHASVTTTQIYTLVTIEHLREVFLSSHPRAHY